MALSMTERMVDAAEAALDAAAGELYPDHADFDAHEAGEIAQALFTAAIAVSREFGLTDEDLTRWLGELCKRPLGTGEQPFMMPARPVSVVVPFRGAVS
ncbi:hypothetical protein [Nioella sp.]|uniref:hypothetical protein n=1 Tax=Nioella sp. TaxID=1912091 RepID=UPI00351850E9